MLIYISKFPDGFKSILETVEESYNEPEGKSKRIIQHNREKNN